MLIVILRKYCIKFSIFGVFARFFGVAQITNCVFWASIMPLFAYMCFVSLVVLDKLV